MFFSTAYQAYKKCYGSTNADDQLSLETGDGDVTKQKQGSLENNGFELEGNLNDDVKGSYNKRDL